MEHLLVSPADYAVGPLPLVFVTGLITATGLIFFSIVIYKRLVPMLKSAPDDRFNLYALRCFHVLKYWLGQKRHPRYADAGIIHIAIFAGFLILFPKTFSMAVMGFDGDFVFPGLTGTLGEAYRILKDYATTLLLLACVAAIIRRAFFLQDRYRVPPKHGKERPFEAFVILGLILSLLLSEACFEAALSSAATIKSGAYPMPPPLTLASFSHVNLKNMNIPSLQGVHVLAYLIHEITFFLFLCYLPFSKHFHVILSMPNVFFKRTQTGNIKPVRFGVEDSKIDELDTFGVKKIEEFTWKGILDFYSCVDCGRCSDNCPATMAGAPLSPRFISIKARDLLRRNYPIWGQPKKSEPLMGNIYEDAEIWACTTCGACEEECPVCIEYIDKIVDLRRGMVDDGNVPKTLQKPLNSLAKRGNPFGKLEKKRSDWTRFNNFSETYPVPSSEKGERFETLFFVDSICSYDDRMVEISRATAKILHHAGENFGILGKQEKDSGNEVKRFGEEMLFLELRAHNIEMIRQSGVKLIVTADPHAFNALTKEYGSLPPVEHISTYILRQIKSGKLTLAPDTSQDSLFVYHDPCYLGRHNLLYQEPREVMDCVPGLRRVEMERSKDRSLCCGGGGLMLFYEPEVETRIGITRVKMARDTGADTIITACPFCFANLNDALKVSGLDMEMRVIDLCELVADHLA